MPDRYTVHVAGADGKVDYQGAVSSGDDPRSCSESARRAALGGRRAEVVDHELNRVIFRAEGDTFRWLTR